ncbi:Tfx family DNA-binding protein [uncultured Methanoregula sp.]|uniref:Tfx family DNA-binding protein n=1 Tax=uncultured Methanoregula sp. TaxID=1005933 RepID=UPI002AAB59D2|nr:Tfx family DNA-binding protein [uncultured Methanoregula sp.]
MRETLFTERQKEVLRYRKHGMTLQQIADILGTSKANICSIEKKAMRKVRFAQETLEFLRTLDAHLLCTMAAGSDLFDSIPILIEEARKTGISLPDDPMDLINRIRSENPDNIRGRYIKKDIPVYLSSDGILGF